jgi:asparagine synthetase B (glutamine-hydrolysing)
MTVAAGLLGYLATDLDPARTGEAQRRSPWRGKPGSTMITPVGGIIGLGSAKAGQYRHLSVAIHGRIDNLPEVARAFSVDETNIIAVLGETYLRYGDDFAGRLLGDFAILVLDERRGTLLGVRDWVGARPLYWGKYDGITAFGSEVKQVLALLNRPYALDEETAAEYRIMGSPLVTATFARGVSAVAPSAQVLAQSNGRVQVTTRPAQFEPLDVSMSEAAELVRVRLDAAVERRSRGSSRPGAFMSGGMDSTSVAATAALLAQRGNMAPLGAALTLHFPEVPGSDETALAKEVADKWGIPWFPVKIAVDEITFDPVDSFEIHDGPVFPGIQFKERLFSQAQRLQLGLVLSGQGADAWLHQSGEELKFALLRHEWLLAIAWTLYGIRRHRRWALRNVAGAVHAALLRRSAQDFFEERLSDFWSRSALEVEERVAQHHGVRVEFPYCDRELVGTLVGVSPKLRSSPSGTKLILRSAMTERLPQSVLSRMDKTFFDPVLWSALGTPGESGPAGALFAQRYLSSWETHLRHDPT